MSKRIYYEAINMAQCAVEEKKTQIEVADEFDVSPSTVRNRMKLIQGTKLYKDVMKHWKIKQ